MHVQGALTILLNPEVLSGPCLPLPSSPAGSRQPPKLGPGDSRVGSFPQPCDPLYSAPSKLRETWPVMEQLVGPGKGSPGVAGLGHGRVQVGGTGEEGALLSAPPCMASQAGPGQCSWLWVSALHCLASCRCAKQTPSLFM